MSVRVFRSLKRLRSVDGFERWLYRLTVNTVFDHLRKRRRRCDIAWSSLDEEQARTVEVAAGRRSFALNEHQKDVRETMSRLLDEIPPRDRVLLILKEVEGLSLKEIGEIHGVRAGAGQFADAAAALL